MREAAVLFGSDIVNVIVIPDGEDGNALLSDLCVEITGLDPKPGLGLGWTFVGGRFVAAEKTWAQIRAKRDLMLDASDWTQVADAPVNSAAWAVYRQTLRDIPQDFDSPDDVVWPETP
jgi:hypothetical protein